MLWQKDTHTCGSPFINCYKCKLQLPKSEAKAHYENCKFWMRRKCNRAKILLTENEKHAQECGGPKTFTCSRRWKHAPELKEHLKAGLRVPDVLPLSKVHVSVRKTEHSKECAKARPAHCYNCRKYGTYTSAAVIGQQRYFLSDPGCRYYLSL